MKRLLVTASMGLGFFLVILPCSIFCLSLLGASAPVTPAAPASKPAGCLDGLREASVLVHCRGASGSGVAFLAQGATFIWTDAHVVEGAKKVETVIDPRTGKSIVRCSFADVVLYRDVVEAGRKVGSETRLARVIRYSERHDIALLRTHAPSWPQRGVVFIDSQDLPRVGEAVWHVGSMRGERGANSVSDGVVAALGRLRQGFVPTDTDDPLVYDQMSMVAHPGSSGGGVFRKSDGKCLGLVTEFLGGDRTFGSLCITPARRLRQFARQARCCWAIDSTIAVPAHDDEPVMQDHFAPPAPAVPAPPPFFPR